MTFLTSATGSTSGMVPGSLRKSISHVEYHGNENNTATRPTHKKKRSKTNSCYKYRIVVFRDSARIEIRNFGLCITMGGRSCFGVQTPDARLTNACKRADCCAAPCNVCTRQVYSIMEIIARLRKTKMHKGARAGWTPSTCCEWSEHCTRDRQCGYNCCCYC